MNGELSIKRIEQKINGRNKGALLLSLSILKYLQFKINTPKEKTRLKYYKKTYSNINHQSLANSLTYELSQSSQQIRTKSAVLSNKFSAIDQGKIETFEVVKGNSESLGNLLVIYCQLQNISDYTQFKQKEITNTEKTKGHVATILKNLEELKEINQLKKSIETIFYNFNIYQLFPLNLIQPLLKYASFKPLAIFEEIAFHDSHLPDYINYTNENLKIENSNDDLNIYIVTKELKSLKNLSELQSIFWDRICNTNTKYRVLMLEGSSSIVKDFLEGFYVGLKNHIIVNKYLDKEKEYITDGSLNYIGKSRLEILNVKAEMFTREDGNESLHYHLFRYLPNDLIFYNNFKERHINETNKEFSTFDAISLDVNYKTNTLALFRPGKYLSHKKIDFDIFLPSTEGERYFVEFKNIWRAIQKINSNKKNT